MPRHDAQSCWTEFSPLLSSLSSVLETVRRQTHYSNLTHVYGRLPLFTAKKLWHHLETQERKNRKKVLTPKANVHHFEKSGRYIRIAGTGDSFSTESSFLLFS